MSRKTLKLSALFASLTLAAAIAGCGTSNKEGNLSLDNVAKVDETLCAQCHGAAVEKLSGDSIYEKYTESVHALKSVGCQDCHGGGAQHNGIGPIPYPKPNDEQCKTCHDADGLVTNYQASSHKNAVTEDGEEKCNRCHTHQGAVLSAKFHFTGDKATMDAKVNAPGEVADAEPIKCNTCHETHKPQELRVDSNWQPSITVGAATVGSGDGYNQYRLCTQCHSYTDANGKLLANGKDVFGTGALGQFYHDTTWNRTIASTHYDSPTTGYGLASTTVEGYVIRTNGETPCFDCHGHESKTNTNALTSTVVNGTRTYSRIDPEETIQTQWAKSGHAGKLLVAKYQAMDDFPKKSDGSYNRNADMTTAIMKAGVTGTSGPAWEHYNWDASSRAACQKCHTATGAANYMTSPSTYNASNNTFTHLSGWTANAGSPQNELLYCWGCHKNAGTGELRTPGAITADYNFGGVKATFPNVGASNTCLVCHSGRESGESVTAIADASFNNVGFKNSHYMAAGGLMYVKAGFTAFVDPATVIGSSTYGKSLTSDADGGSLTSTHRKLGTSAIVGDHGITASQTNLTANGPCVTCHLNGGDHSLEMNANAYNKVCVNCHTKEGTTALTADNFNAAFIEPQKEAFENALALAEKVLADNYNIKYDSSKNPYFFENDGTTAVTDWTRSGALSLADAKKLMGACFNINLLTRDPAAFAHARTYSRRLVYDTIDFLDNKVIDLSVGTTAVGSGLTDGSGNALFGKNATNAYADGTLATLASGTTESMVYLLGWSRSTGKWNTPERP